MTRRSRRVGAVAVAVAMSPVALAVPAAAAGLEQADAVVDVDDQGTAHVEIGYVVTGGADGDEPAETVSFSALAFDDAGAVPIEDVVVATGDGQELDTSVETVKLKTTVTATLAEPLSPGDESELTVSYAAPDVGVVDGARMTSEVPVLALDLPAASTSPGIFTASVQLAPGYDYVEGFPANPESVATSGDRVEVSYDTPAVPALLRSVGTTGDAPFFTLERSVNLALALTLVAGGAVLYVSFTRGRKRAAEVAAAAERRH